MTIQEEMLKALDDLRARVEAGKIRGVILLATCETNEHLRYSVALDDWQIYGELTCHIEALRPRVFLTRSRDLIDDTEPARPTPEPRSPFELFMRVVTPEQQAAERSQEGV